MKNLQIICSAKYVVGFFILFLSQTLTAQELLPPGMTPNGDILAMDSKDGILYMGGFFDKVGYLTGGAALLEGSSTKPDFNFPTIDGKVYAIVSDGTGGWYIGGEFESVGQEPRANIVHILSDYTIDPDFSPEINDKVNDLIIKDNILYIVGKFTQIDNNDRNYVAAYDLDAGSLTGFDPSPDRQIFAVEIYKEFLIIGGFFEGVAGVNQARLAKIDLRDGTNSAVPSPPVGFVYDLLVKGDTVFVGGAFDNALMAVNLSNNTLLTWAPTISAFNNTEKVNALAMIDKVLYFGGRFSKVNNKEQRNLAGVSLNGNLTSFRPEPNEEVFELYPDGDSLYIGGEFTDIRNAAISYAAKIDGATGLASSWEPSPDWVIRSFSKAGNKLLMGGEIEMLNKTERDNACAIDIATGELTDWNPKPGFLGVSDLKLDRLRDAVYLIGFYSNTRRHLKAYDLAARDEIPGWELTFDGQVSSIDQDTISGNIYIGGEFTTINGETHNKLAGITPTGALIALNTAIDGVVSHIAFSEEHNAIYFSGNFETVNNQTRKGIAAINNQGQLQAWYPEIDGMSFDVWVNDILPTSDKVYLAGNFESINGEARNRLGAVDPVTGALLPFDAKLESLDIYIMEPTETGIFIVGKGLSKVGSTLVNHMAYIGATSGLVLQDIDGETPPAGSALVENTFPKKGGNTGSVTLEIVGEGFLEGTTVTLSGEGFDDIPFSVDTSVIYDENRILASFNLREAPLGVRDIEINIPGDGLIIVEDAFEIIEGTEVMTWADVVGPSFVVSNTPRSFYLSYGNSGNIDAVGVPVWLAMSPNIELIDIGFEMFDIFDPADPLYDSIPEYILVDTLAGQPMKAKVYGFIIPRIEASRSKTVRFTIKGSELGGFYTRAWASRPLYGSPLKYAFGECADAWISNAIGFIPGAGCAFGIADIALSPMFDYMNDPDFGSFDYVTSYLQLIASTAVGCGADVVTGGMGGSLIHIAEEALTLKSIVDLWVKCWPAKDKENKEGEIVSSWDPNDKSGLSGRGAKDWVRTNKRFPYMIRFENDPEATAPAKEVIVRDTLDASVFDLASLQLKGFAIADSFYTIPSGYSEYSLTIDLRPRLPYLVESDVALENGLLTWKFTTLDPVSKEPVTDPLGGFLPPNIDTLSGQGAIFFDIAVHDTISNGREINNSAAIYFDFNAPVITNNWKLTADNGGLESAVEELDETQPNTGIQLEWPGTDQGAGIIYYDVLFRKDSASWQYASVQTTDTSMVFTGEMGAHYEFYTIAYDSALNVEPAPVQPDARVTITDDITAIAQII